MPWKAALHPILAQRILRRPGERPLIGTGHILASKPDGHCIPTNPRDHEQDKRIESLGS